MWVVYFPSVHQLFRFQRNSYSLHSISLFFTLIRPFARHIHVPRCLFLFVHVRLNRVWVRDVPTSTPHRLSHCSSQSTSVCSRLRRRVRRSVLGRSHTWVRRRCVGCAAPPRTCGRWAVSHRRWRRGWRRTESTPSWDSWSEQQPLALRGWEEYCRSFCLVQLSLIFVL